MLLWAFLQWRKKIFQSIWKIYHPTSLFDESVDMPFGALHGPVTGFFFGALSHTWPWFTANSYTTISPEMKSKTELIECTIIFKELVAICNNFDIKILEDINYRLIRSQIIFLLLFSTSQCKRYLNFIVVCGYALVIDILTINYDA